MLIIEQIYVCMLARLTNYLYECWTAVFKIKIDADFFILNIKLWKWVYFQCTKLNIIYLANIAHGRNKLH